jgi:hypothetical protein
MKGTLASVAIGWPAFDVGVPTAPTIEHFFFAEHLLRRLDRLLRLIAVVGGFQLDLAASNSTGAICFREGGEKALAHTLAERLGRAFKRRDLTEDNPIFGDTIFGARGSASKTKGNN